MQNNFLKRMSLLITILVSAVILRFYDLSLVPPSLNWDEVSHGYNAYSILKNGSDEWGVSWPTIFRAYGDYKLPVYIYLTSFQEFIFGLNAFAVRIISAIAGIGLVIFSYLLTRKLYGNKVGLITSFLVTIEPWSLFLSRGAFEANLGQFFAVSGVYFLLKGFERHKLLLLSSLLFGLSVWTYNSERVFVPLLVVTLLFIWRKTVKQVLIKNKLLLVLSLIILSLFLTSMFLQLTKSEGQARYGRVSIVDEGAIGEIEQKRINSELPSEINRLVNNRYFYFFEHFTKNYLSHFSPNFLFLSGGSNYQFNIPNTGVLYLIDAPLVLLGLWCLFKNKSPQNLTILSWVLIAPLASSLTREAPHTLRAITFLPIPMILAALGMIKLEQVIKSKFIVPAFLLLSLVLGARYLDTYFNVYPKEYSQAWQYGYKEVVEYAKENYDKYDQVIMTKKYGEPHEFFLFYWPWDPEKYRNDPNLVRYAQSDWYWVDSFDKFVFVNDWDIPKNENIDWKTERDKPIDVSLKTLLITSPGIYPRGWKKLETINFLDDKPAFDILENNVANN